MSEATVRTILRLLAVVTILVGAILVTMSLVQLVGASRMVGDLQIDVRGFVNDGMAFALLAQAVVVGEGFLLYAMSDSLARKIVG